MEKLLEGIHRKTHTNRPVQKPAADMVTDAILEEILKAAGLEELG